MASIVPTKRPAKIAFFRSKLAPWQANLAALGLLAGDMSGLTTAVDEADEAMAAAIALAAQARAAMLTYHAKTDFMVSLGMDCVGKIRVKANQSGDPAATYALAQLPPPSQPSPVPPPGTPDNFKVELRQDGAMLLKWKCVNHKRTTGVTYTIRRMLGGGGEFVQLGITGKKELIDAAVPAGTAQVLYEITAVRSTATGAPAIFTVNLGVGAGGEMTAAVAASPKLAA